jgi:hypothetical protein
MADPAVIIRRNADESVDEIVAQNCSVHLEQMDGNSFYLGIEAEDGSYWQFWLGARNRKSLVDVKHTETTPKRDEP